MPSVCFPRISTIASLGEFASSSPLFERAVVSRVVAVFSHRGAHSTQKTTDHSLHKPSFSSDAPVSINLKRNHPTGKELHKASGLKPFTPRSSRTAFSLLVLVLHLPNVGRQVPMLRQGRGSQSPLRNVSVALADDGRNSCGTSGSRVAPTGEVRSLGTCGNPDAPISRPRLPAGVV